MAVQMLAFAFMLHDAVRRVELDAPRAGDGGVCHKKYSPVFPHP
jgi:hypothetical protein